MTRINLVPVTSLIRQHLVAEYRELPRIITQIEVKVRSDPYLNEIKKGGLPSTYRMGTGHMKFFWNKADFLAARFDQLVSEMRARGYHTSFVSLWPRVDALPSYCRQPWSPGATDIAVSQSRINDRLSREI